MTCLPPGSAVVCTSNCKTDDFKRGFELTLQAAA